MGACATKPKVLSKDGAAEGAAPAPEVKEEETVVVSEVKEVVVVSEQVTVQGEGSGVAEQEDIKPRSLDNLIQEGEVKEISGATPQLEEAKAEEPVVATSTAESEPVIEEKKSITTEVIEEKPKSETLEIDVKTDTPQPTATTTTVEKPATEEKK
ncbi:uncharacterized protein LOC124922570 [Impatiens glandulifera]|uniref:uncharacterized protein LOC124922570 n=1 Tax=Impatiens glandulifera TaxID=253017 RepID=UPI001FB04E71|nr:uncharacterized protein LOC124922570 [Impatiens glandulifera]